MKKFFTCMLLLLLAAGCAFFNVDETVNNAKKLRVGMTKAEVLTIMGEPLKDESFHRPDLWYYYYKCNWMDGLYTEEVGSCCMSLLRSPSTLGLLPTAPSTSTAPGMFYSCGATRCEPSSV